MRKIDRTGEINTNKYGSKMTIIEYVSNKNIIIEFENGYKIKGNYILFKNGKITNPYDKTVLDIGYIGEYPINKKDREVYICWNSMLIRCYGKHSETLNPTYKDCTVCDEWHNFQNFKKWYYENYYKIEGQTMCLDKDILVKGNKLYSPKNCIFVPNRINVLFVKSDKVRGNCPIGVSYDKRADNYSSKCSILKNNKKYRITIGAYNTTEEAFYKGYKPFKEQYIKQVAEEYKNKIPQKLYNAMCNYIVEITD